MGVHRAVLKVLAFPFLLAGIKMHRTENNSLKAIIVGTIVYMVPYTFAYIAIATGKKTLLPNRDGKAGLSFKQFLIFYLKCYGVVFVLLAVMFVAFLMSGMGQVVRPSTLYWIMFLVEPEDYTNAGLLRFMALALAFNALILVTPFMPLRPIVHFTKESKMKPISLKCVFCPICI